MTLSTNMLYVMSRDLNNIKILGQVIKLAKERKASLTVLDVIDSLPRANRMLITAVPTADLRDNLVSCRLGELEALVSRFGSDANALQPRVTFGDRATEIVREAADGAYDLVIKNPGRRRTDRDLLQNCSCPVWLLKPDDYDAAGQLIASRCPLWKTADSTAAVQYRITPAAKPRAGWVSRAQTLFR